MPLEHVFGKPQKVFGPKKPFIKIMNHSFYKAVILACLLETSLFTRYSVN